MKVSIALALAASVVAGIALTPAFAVIARGLAMVRAFLG